MRQHLNAGRVLILVLIFGLISGLALPSIAGAEALASEYLDQEVPPRMARGASYSVSLTFKNTGTETWTGGGDYFLQARNPRNNDNWGIRRVSLPDGAMVTEGNSVTITFDVTAPSVVGPENFQWRMKKLGDVDFGEFSPNLVIDIGEEDLEATFSLVSIPARLKEGERKIIHLEVDNSGNVTWDDATQFLFQAAAPLNNRTWGVRRVDFDLDEPVQPGETYRQSFEIMAPRKPGITPIRWVVKQFGGGLYSEVSPDRSIEVLRSVHGAVRFNPTVYNSVGTNVARNLVGQYDRLGPAGMPTVREQVQTHLSQISEATELTHILLNLSAHKDLPWDDTLSSQRFDNLVLLIEDAYERGLGTMLEVGHACTVPAEVMPAPDDPQGRVSLCGHDQGEVVVHGNGATTLIQFDIPFVPTAQNYISEAKRFYLDLILGLKQELSQGAYESMDFFLRGNHLNVFGAELRLNHTDPYLDWTLDYLGALVPYLQDNTDVSLGMLTRLYTNYYADDEEGYEHLSILHDRPSIVDNLEYLAITAGSPLTPETKNTLPEQIALRLQEFTYKTMLADFSLGGGGPEAGPQPPEVKEARIAAQFLLMSEQGFNSSFQIWSYQGDKNFLREPGQYATASEGWLTGPIDVIDEWILLP